MDKRQLNQALQPFYAALRSKYDFIIEFRIRDAFPGLGMSMFNLDIITSPISVDKYDEILDDVYLILWDVIDESVRGHIWTTGVEEDVALDCELMAVCNCPLVDRG